MLEKSTNKPLFITVDTEGDSLWDNPKEISTENVLYIPRLQALCEKYNFIPIWLTDYEMIKDRRFTDYITEKYKNSLCEVGIHIHARNNPPIYSLPNEDNNGAAYLIEYPESVLRDKILYLKNFMEDTLQEEIITHRAGRWTIDKRYVDALFEFGIKYDCSVTPEIDWSHCKGITREGKGSDYSGNSRERMVLIKNDIKQLIEYPMTIVECNQIILPSRYSIKSIARCIRNAFKTTKLWIRPRIDNFNEMKFVIDYVTDNDEEFAEFMIHSSELMPGGGQNHLSRYQIDKLFDTIEKFFSYAKECGYFGSTFSDWEKRRCT